MLKYVDTKVVFAEVPDEITLAINISNCPCHCVNCHSAYLAEDVGEPLTKEALSELINSNKGITCIAFMGGDAEPLTIDKLAEFIKETYPEIKIAWYSGRQGISQEINIDNFDFIKIGPYLKEYGPLNCKSTNQRFFKVFHTSAKKSKLYDITYKFQKNND